MGKYSILVVDDEVIICESLGFDLREHNYEVSLAHKGEEAIDKLNKTDYDLIITDLSMPGMDGLEVLKAAKRKNSNALVMILTGYSSLESAIEALKLGAADYMLKPYDKTEMLLRITNCFKKLELQKQIAIFEKILPVCCKCKKIRNDSGKEHGEGEWINLESYLEKVCKVDVTPGRCPKCNV